MSGRLIVIFMLLAPAACTLGRGGPGFKKFSSRDTLSPPHDHVRAGSIELFVEDCEVGGTYDAIGRDNRELTCTLSLTNHGPTPYLLPKRDDEQVNVRWKQGTAGAFASPVHQNPWVDRSLPPGATGEIRVTSTGHPYDVAYEIVFQGAHLPVDR